MLEVYRCWNKNGFQINEEKKNEPSPSNRIIQPCKHRYTLWTVALVTVADEGTHSMKWNEEDEINWLSDTHTVTDNISFRLQTLARLCSASILIFISHFFLVRKFFHPPEARSQTTSTKLFILAFFFSSSTRPRWLAESCLLVDEANRHIPTHCLSSHFRPIESIMLFVCAYTTSVLRHVFQVSSLLPTLVPETTKVRSVHR